MADKKNTQPTGQSPLADVASLVTKIHGLITKTRNFQSAAESASQFQKKKLLLPQETSPSFDLAFSGNKFLLRDDMRHIRLQLEYEKCQSILEEHNINGTIVLFGSARLYDQEDSNKMLAKAEKELAALESQESADEKALAKARYSVKFAKKKIEQVPYYEQARELGKIITERVPNDEVVVITGGGPGIMEAGNRGAHDANGKSVGLAIALPFEQHPNPYITPSLSFSFHYFSIRKMHFLLRARALVAFPGGWGTMDELFEALTLIQTQKMRKVPVILFGRKFWDKIVDMDAILEEAMISPEDMDLFSYAETAEEVWDIICKHC